MRRAREFHSETGMRFSKMIGLPVFCGYFAGAAWTDTKPKAEEKWVDQGKVKLSDERQRDGDSFGIMVEVTAPDGERRMLHELLVENGHARAYGTPAAWPPKEEDRHGEEAAKRKFREELKKLEEKAKRAGLGAWAKPGK